MKKLTPHILSTLAVAGIALAAPAWAQQPAEPAASEPAATEPATKRMTGTLPEDALAARRAGAIGENPEQVDQGGAAGPDVGEAAEPSGELPEGTLAEKRGGAIGEDPDPVVQGGAGDTAAERKADETPDTVPGMDIDAAGEVGSAGSDLGASDVMPPDVASETKALRMMGKPATLASGEEVGTVDDIVIDESDATAKEIVVMTTGDQSRKVSIPADQAKLGDDNAAVVIDMEQEEFAALPDYEDDTQGGMSTMVGEEEEEEE